MRTFMICLLAVGALAGESSGKTSLTKHAKRASLTSDHGSNVYNSQQFEQQLARYTQPRYLRVAETGPLPGYTSHLAYQAASLPAENQHQHATYPAGVVDNQLRQMLLRQSEQGLDHSADSQLQQAAEGVHGYRDSVVIAGQRSGATVRSAFVGTPVLAGHQVPVLQLAGVSRSSENVAPGPGTVYAIRNYPVNVDRAIPLPAEQPLRLDPASVPVSLEHPVPIQIFAGEALNSVTDYNNAVVQVPNAVLDNGVTQEQADSQGPLLRAFHQGPTDLGGLEGPSNSDGLSDHRVVDAASQQQIFGGQEALNAAHVLENAFPNTYKTVTYERNVEQLGNHGSGYHYDQPATRFTF